MTDIEVLSPPTPEVIKMVRESVGVDEKKLAEAKEQLRQWLEKKPHLPHCIDDKRLENIYLRCKGSIERAKSALDMYYTVRTAIPEFFAQRDIAEPWGHISQLIYFFALPKLTDDGYRVIVNGYFNAYTENYSAALEMKLVFMVLDVLLLEDYATGHIIVCDCKNMKLVQAASFTPPVVRKAMTTLLHGFSLRLKGIYVINAPPYVVPIVNFIRSIVKPKIANRIFVESDCSILPENILKMLPYDFQGEARSLMDMWNAWIRKLHSYRSWFTEEENCKADESKRLEPLPNRDGLFGYDGSFRQLDID